MFRRMPGTLQLSKISSMNKWMLQTKPASQNLTKRREEAFIVLVGCIKNKLLGALDESFSPTELGMVNQTTTEGNHLSLPLLLN